MDLAAQEAAVGILFRWQYLSGGQKKPAEASGKGRDLVTPIKPSGVPHRAVSH